MHRPADGFCNQFFASPCSPEPRSATIRTIFSAGAEERRYCLATLPGLFIVSMISDDSVSSISAGIDCGMMHVFPWCQFVWPFVDFSALSGLLDYAGGCGQPLG